MFGIVMGSEADGLRIWTYPILLAATLRIFFTIWNRQNARFSPIILFVAIGFLSIQPWASPRLPANHISRFVDGLQWRIVGVVANRPAVTERYTRIIVDAESLQRHSKTRAVVGKIRLTASNPTIALNRGDRIAFTSSIRSIRNFQNPGGFDYQRYMAFKGVWVSAYTKGFRLTCIETEKRGLLSSWVIDVRRAVNRLIEKSTTGDQQAILKALLVGDRSQITPSLRNDFHRTGTGHLLAISGLHVGIVAAAAFYFFVWLLSRFKVVLWTAWSRKGAALLSLFPVAAYATLAGMSPSTQRALIMVSIYLMTFVFEKEHDLYNTLAIAALLILAISPSAIWSISFQLSFMSVLSIIYGVSQIPRADEHPVVGKWFKTVRMWRRKMVVFAMVSVFATLGTLPIVMAHFNQVSLIGFAANCIFVPIIGFLIVPVGLLCVVLLPFCEPCAMAGIKLCDIVLMHSLGGLQWIAELPFAAVKTITPTAIESVCYYVLLWGLMQSILKKTKKPSLIKGSDSIPQAFSTKRPLLLRLNHFLANQWPIVLAMMAAVVLSADMTYWIYQRYLRTDMEVTILDVANGNAALLELPKGHCMLIDGGGFSDNTAFDMGARVVAPFLWRKKIKTIDTIVLSHPNSDHLNGLLYIAKHFNIKTVWSNNEVRNTAGYQQFRRIIDERKIKLTDYGAMPLKMQINGVHFEILYPPKDFLRKRADQPWRNTNNNSLVVKVTMGIHSILFPGDIMAMAEKELVYLHGEKLNSTVLIVPHHGSNSSSTDGFLEKVNARYAIVSSRFGNRYRFPHTAVLKRLRQHNCKIFRTDETGALIIGINDQEMSLMAPLTRMQVVER